MAMPSIDPAQLNPIASEERDIADADLAQCLLDLREGFAKFVKQTGDAPDKIAKGPEFVSFLLGRVVLVVAPVS